MATHVVRVDPDGIELDARDGETVMAAALRHGYKWPTVCHGDGTCGICRIEVVSGGDRLEPISSAERQTLEAFKIAWLENADIRLACRAKVYGDLVVLKKGVRKAPGAR